VFAGGFSLPAAAAVCCGGDETATLDLVDQLAGKSLITAQTSLVDLGENHGSSAPVRSSLAVAGGRAGRCVCGVRRHAGCLAG
jgi:hypothetical protein